MRTAICMRISLLFLRFSPDSRGFRRDVGRHAPGLDAFAFIYRRRRRGIRGRQRRAAAAVERRPSRIALTSSDSTVS